MPIKDNFLCAAFHINLQILCFDTDEIFVKNNF